MTVSSTTTKVSYSGNGSTTAFAYTFKIFDEDDLTVILRTDATGTEAVQTKTSDYTVSGVGNANGGNVTFGTAPASGKTVVIRRSAALTQTTDYTPNDPFPAEEHENALDKLTFLTQQIQEEVDRSIKLSRTNTMTSTEFTVGATDRANKILAFDSSGEISVTQELGTFVGDWAASTSYNARDIVKDTSTNNIFICTTSHTSSGSQPLTTNTDSAKWSLLVDAASATTAATTATTKASEAATSATAAASSATSATSSASSATSSASTASTAATAAQTAQTAAETAETNAETAETNAETAETNAASSATAAASSATSAASSATTATTKASEASTSATNAAASATTATTKASEAATSATNASSSASTATTKASEASTSATNAASSATAAASSATASASSATSAANSAAAAASSYDTFDDRYLGSKTSDPSVDNDGNALVTGALYFNSSANEMRVYDGANWIAASSAGTASLILYEYTATSGQTTFSGSDDNSATLSYSVGNIQVVMNGVILDPSDFTATSGTSVVLASGAATGDLLNIYAFKSFTVSDTVSASAGGTFAGNVTVNALLNVDNLRLDGNTISSTDTNGDITIDPDGTGDTIIASGNLGVGTTSPTASLTVGAADNEGTLRIGDNGTYYGEIKRINASDELRIGHYGGSQKMTLYTAGSERMRIDSDGVLLNGKTSSAFGNVGQEFHQDGTSLFTRSLPNGDSAGAAYFRRNTSDGSILLFYKDGSNIGSIGCRDGFVTIYNGDTGLGFDAGSDHIRPMSSTGSRDNAIDLGRSATRFDDIYATNGTIQTSDQNEKQQIASLTTAEITAAKAISQLFKTFKWNDKVEAKGDDARIHTGVIAQEVQTAMTDAGLDAADYAFWCSDTWWETSTDVSAVEAVDEVTDEDGNVTTEAVEAKDAYTRIDRYETSDEVPDGATQRTRMGIRYPELLAFIGAATEQRLADIETRLTALEAE
jgi:hypothetical protein